MQAVYLESLVEAFLLQSRDTLIAPQYLIRVDGQDRYPDVLAVRPNKKTFYLVEVTESRSAKTLLPKLVDYRKCADTTATRLSEEFGLDGDWKVKPWLFIRKDAEKAFTSALESAGFKWKEDVCRTFVEDLLARMKPEDEALNETRWGKRTKSLHGTELATPE